MINYPDIASLKSKDISSIKFLSEKKKFKTSHSNNLSGENNTGSLQSAIDSE